MSSPGLFISFSWQKGLFYGRDFRHVLTTIQKKSTRWHSNIPTFQHLNLQLATVRCALAD